MLCQVADLEKIERVFVCVVEEIVDGSVVDCQSRLGDNLRLVL